MKKQLLSITAVAGLLAWGLPIGGTQQASAEVESASDTIVIYVLKAAGRGWGIDRAARAAVEKQEGVGKVFVTGANAWFVMEGDAKPDEAKLKADVEAGRLTFESLTANEKPRPKAAWLIESGFGWADTSVKAGAALEEVEGMQAYVGRQIVIHTVGEEMPDKDAIQAKLTPFNLTIGEIKRDDSLLF